MPTSPPFVIRSATDQSDAAFIVASFDASVQHLSATGNADHWGTQPFSSKPGFLEETGREVAQSEVFRRTGEGERIRVFIAQAEDDDDGPSAATEDGLHRRKEEEVGDGQRIKTYIPIGAMTIRDDEFASHINTTDILKPHLQQAKQSSFVYIDVVLTDFRLAPHKRQGAGAALIQRAKEYARERGKKSVYYENLGFVPVQDYQVVQKTGKIWPARFFRFDLSNDEIE
ncbi:hypothetical protein PT974_01998 [Cladobotryum mycophilum]|uniref:N-acetyltransferase domain-containing protein n=1 Tax=Cladobotryum mycophilum TaxID=491253 RepID=A0ABR0SX07_9HYPO